MYKTFFKHYIIFNNYKFWLRSKCGEFERVIRQCYIVKSKKNKPQLKDVGFLFEINYT